MTGLLDVESKLQIVAESAIAAAAGQGPLTADHDRHRAIHHRDDVAVAPLQQVRVHRLVVLAPEVAGGASVAAADLEMRVQRETGLLCISYTEYVDISL